MQPYRYENEIIIHVLNYTWVGSQRTEPNRVALELVVPHEPDLLVERIVQSEPQWQTLKELQYSSENNDLIVPLKAPPVFLDTD